MEASE